MPRNLPACVRIEADDTRSRESLLKDGWEEVEILETWQRVIGNEDYECGLVFGHLDAPIVHWAREAARGGKDSRIPKEQREDYYHEWIKRAVEARQPMFEVPSEGFIILREDGAIDLLRVGLGYRGKGVGTTLVNNAMVYFRARGMRTIRAGTQSTNAYAQRFYSKLGFTVVKRERTFHKEVG